MSDKVDINKLADLTKFQAAIKHLNQTLDDLRVEVIALLHDKESLKRENAVLRRLLDE